ncbi:MAG: germination protein YpeB [Bacillota bacterium]|nr:germination protein YpeB [Bacillota bacterium]
MFNLMKFTRRKLIRIISVCVAVVVVTAGFSVNQFMVSRSYRNQIKAGYQRSLFDLNSYISQIGTTLEKNMIASSPAQMVKLSSDIWRLSGAAKASLAELPLSAYNIEKLQKYLSQVGDYVYTLSQKAVSGTGISKEEYTNMEYLYQYNKELSDELQDMSYDYFNDQSDFAEVISSKKTLLDFFTRRKLPDMGANLSGSLDRIKEYPELNYEGLFSSHQEKVPPIFLQNANNVTIAEARHSAAVFLQCNDSDLKDAGETLGKIQTYNFSIDNKTVTVSKQGGYVITLLAEKVGTDQKISKEDAIAKAQALLNRIGLANMINTYNQVSGAEITMNFVYYNNNIVYYNDLVQVQVCMETGNICGYDSRGYMSNHDVNRTFSANGINTGDLLKKLSDGLTPVKYRFAVIPNDAKVEVLTLEVMCEDKNKNQFLVFLNTTSGKEERISMLNSNDQGDILT